MSKHKIAAERNKKWEIIPWRTLQIISHVNQKTSKTFLGEIKNG